MYATYGTLLKALLLFPYNFHVLRVWQQCIQKYHILKDVYLYFRSLQAVECHSCQIERQIVVQSSLLVEQRGGLFVVTR